LQHLQLEPSNRRFLVTVPIGVSQGRISAEIGSRINSQIRSQFSIMVQDDNEIIVESSMTVSLSLVRKDHCKLSPIINSINYSERVKYLEDRKNQDLNVGTTTIELDRISITNSKSRKAIARSSFNIWPLQLNIPQLCDANNQSQMMEVINSFTQLIIRGFFRFLAE
jgi:predicted PilT family ATPase